MKQCTVLFCFIVLSVITNVYGQKFSETNLSLGVSRPSSTTPYSIYQDVPPAYLIFNATKSFYSNDHRFSLRKEIGFNLQYSNIHFDTGGLGAHNYYTGNVASLTTDFALLVRFQINNTLAFSIGPEAEILLIGNTYLRESYYTMVTTPPSSGLIIESGLNRDYFNHPIYGIKARLFESAITEKTIIGLGISYLWTKQEHSSFYASNYTRISFFLGFKNQK